MLLNQVRAGLGPAFVREVSMRVCVCVDVCMSAPEAMNNESRYVQTVTFKKVTCPHRTSNCLCDARLTGSSVNSLSAIFRSNMNS